jgi:hypothetical protein
MPDESKTKLFHTYPDEPLFECSTGDMTGEGFEITMDKSTHEFEIPRDRETEDAVTIIVRPKAKGTVQEFRTEGNAGASTPLSGQMFYEFHHHRNSLRAMFMRAPLDFWVVNSC